MSVCVGKGGKCVSFFNFWRCRGVVPQWQSICNACRRFHVQSLSLTRSGSKHLPETLECRCHSEKTILAFTDQQSHLVQGNFKFPPVFQSELSRPGLLFLQWLFGTCGCITCPVFIPLCCLSVFLFLWGLRSRAGQRRARQACWPIRTFGPCSWLIDAEYFSQSQCWLTSLQRSLGEQSNVLILLS